MRMPPHFSHIIHNAYKTLSNTLAISDPETVINNSHRNTVFVIFQVKA